MRYFFLFLLSLSSMISYGQLQMKIKHLHVKDVICQSGVDDWDFRQSGPILELVCLIENKSDSVYIFPVSEDPEQFVHIGRFLYNFSYKGRKYMGPSGNDMFSKFSGVIGKDTLDTLPATIFIQPYQTIEIWTYAKFFPFFPFWDVNKDDYTRELLEILPTLKVRYETPKFTLFTTEIMDVSVDYYVKDK